MSIILKGIDLPKDEKKPLKIEIWSNGDTYKDYGYGYEYKEGIAIQIPKGHGRLIDGDRLIRNEIDRFLYHLNNGDTAVPKIDIINAPTILEAEGEE